MPTWVLAMVTALLLSGCANPKGAAGESVTAVLDGHNTTRSAVGVPDLTWSDDLAAIAANWGAGCRFEHSNGSTGENLYATSQLKLPEATVLAAAVKSWADEKRSYSYSSNTCASGALCGHYTQMVWKQTRQVGCAVVSCPQGMESFQAGTLVVCEYDPPGNYRGQRPY
jgi:pathogenesis-related protein 1